MFGVLNVYLKQRFCGQLSWESERNRYVYRYVSDCLSDPSAERLSFSLPRAIDVGGVERKTPRYRALRLTVCGRERVAELGGADRTGCLAFLVQGLCGVAEEDLIKDWELTGCYTARMSFTHEKCIDRFLKMLMDYPGTTVEQRIRAFLLDCGVSDLQIEAVRKALLP